jgi:hypothetical protein
MAKRVRSTSAAAGGAERLAPAAGSVRACELFRGELWRHRVMTADGLDYVVTTADERHRGQGFVTASYPVASGYLVMLRQALCVLTSEDEAEAHERHRLLVKVLAEAGTRVVRARRNLSAWQRAERRIDAPRVKRSIGAERGPSELVTAAAEGAS